MPFPSFADCLVAAVGGNSSLVAFPAQANYSAIVAPYNLDYPVVPAAVAFPHTVAQVSGLVSCAVESGYRVQAKSGGHSAGNYDPSTFVANVGPGLLLGEIDELMYNAGQRFIPHGASSLVGMGGHGTVGGAGYTWRQYGLTIDHLVEVEVVLADSAIVRASAEENPDLFFAVRGAGASFGIVTDFVFQTLPSPPETISFSYLWTTTDAPSRAEIFKAWQAWSTGPSLSPEMQTILAITQDSIYMGGAYFGTLDEFNALGISDILPPAQQVSADSFTSFLELSQVWGGQLGQSGREAPSFFYTKSSFFRPQTAIPDTVVDQLFDYLATVDTGAESWDIEVQAGGGQNGAVPASATAFPHRDAIFVLLSYAATNGSVTATTTDFLDNFHALAKSAHPDEYYGEYAGFIDARAEPERARYNYWGSNLETLGRIKAAYDPNDVFHNEQSVLPSRD
ncbi:hypothetical protein B0I37DRAFT_428871 [Chaetomium sp. MPI-CAGE-AT-0009]|nr:hypothetical protein B0I37DRAFT_428871 [Chaetomium sp. MPI-CAGE-AT-0009]